ncbi:MAG: hypothetical protein WDW36_004340 [Sanguina aurantia]
MSRSLSQRSAANVRPVAVMQSRRSVKVSAASIEELHTKFGIEGSVQVVAGRGGLPSVVLKHNNGSSAEVVLFGGVVSSWKQPSGDEVLYVRPDAVFDKSKPISGGIPHCFPQFGPGAMQQHGFARNLDWAIASTSADPNPDDKDPMVEITLTENEYTTKMWPFKFKVVYSVSLHGESLRTDLRVINTDDKPFDFSAALHSYIEVLSVQQASVLGLKGLTYLDKSKDASNPTSMTESRDAVTFTGPTDSVYLNSPEQVQLDVGTGAAVALESTGWSDTVVWSPWTAMPACYERFVCVENAQVKPTTVAPGESWRATSNFTVIDTVAAPSS